jgi:hypothetical protein
LLELGQEHLLLLLPLLLLLQTFPHPVGGHQHHQQQQQQDLYGSAQELRKALAVPNHDPCDACTETQ